jgi:hypothetical protein
LPPPHLLNTNKLLLNKRFGLAISLALTSLTLRKRLLAAALATNSVSPSTLGHFEEATASTLPNTTIVTMTGTYNVAAKLML